MKIKKLTEAIVRKDSSVNKVQFDREWFYVVEDMEDYLNEDLSKVEAVTLAVTVEGQTFKAKCATWDDITRALETDSLEDFKGSVLRKKS